MKRLEAIAEELDGGDPTRRRRPQEAPAEDEMDSSDAAAGRTENSEQSQVGLPHRRSSQSLKQAQLIAMLRRAKGAAIDEIAEALEWQPHTVRGAIAGALKKKLGLVIESEKIEGRGRVYKITT